MKCDKYKKLIEKLAEEKLSSSETELMLKHAEQCTACQQEYSAALNYKTITTNLKEVKPVLENKGELIDKILNELPDKKKTSEPTKVVKHSFIYSKFRRALASAAAILVLFFVVQQTNDAWLVKQLETKIAKKNIYIDYNTIREKSILRTMTNAQNEKDAQLLLSKYKALFFNKAFTLVNYKNNYMHLRFNKTFLK